MQREKNILFIILALLFAVLATGAVFLYMKNYEDRIISQSGQSVSVIGKIALLGHIPIGI